MCLAADGGRARRGGRAADHALDAGPAAPAGGGVNPPPSPPPRPSPLPPIRCLLLPPSRWRVRRASEPTAWQLSGGGLVPLPPRPPRTPLQGLAGGTPLKPAGGSRGGSRRPPPPPQRRARRDTRTRSCSPAFPIRRAGAQSLPSRPCPPPSPDLPTAGTSGTRLTRRGSAYALHQQPAPACPCGPSPGHGCAWCLARTGAASGPSEL